MKRFIMTIIAAALLGTAVYSLPSENTAAFPMYALNSGTGSAAITVSSSSSDASDLVTELFVYLWLFNNLTVNFDDYPYKDGKYLIFDDTSSVFAGKSCRFAIDASMFSIPHYGSGVSLRLEGYLWKFFGPLVEFNMYNDELYATESSYQNNGIPSVSSAFNMDSMELRIGAEFAIFQTNPLSASWYIQWFHLNRQESAPIDGCCMGLILRSYPVAPLLIEWRLMTHDVSSESSSISADFMQSYMSHLEVGIMVSGPWQVFAAWEYYSNYRLNTEGNGISAGVRLHM